MLICWHYCVALRKSCLCNGRYAGCFALQRHTATYSNRALHGNTLQHAAAHCHILPRNPTHCNRLQQVATSCNTLACRVRSVCACFSSLTHSIMSKPPLIIYTHISTQQRYFGATAQLAAARRMTTLDPSNVCLYTHKIHIKYIHLYVYIYTQLSAAQRVTICNPSNVCIYKYIYMYT